MNRTAPIRPCASPTLRFLVSHPAHFIALGFGAGLARFAPGTFGTLVAIPIAVLYRTFGSDAAFALIGAAAIVGAAATYQPVAFVALGALACTLLYGWEFLLTRRAPLEAVTRDEARGYKRNWALASLATLAASAAIAFPVTRF